MYSLIFDGNAYVIPVTRTSAGEITSVHIANPGEVVVEWDNRQIGRKYSWRDKHMVPDEELIHISINRYPGAVKGVGPITAQRNMLAGAKAEQDYAKRLFEDDATPNLAINVIELLSVEEAKEVLANWNATHQGRKGPAIMSGGATLQPISINPVDAEFLESRKWTVTEIARMLGIPAFMLSVSGGDSLTYSTTESLFRLFLMQTLNPTYLERIEQSFSKLLPEGEKARFDTSELLRADDKSRYEGFKTAIEAGWLAPNEVRENEGLTPMAGGEGLRPSKKDSPADEEDLK